MPDKAVSPKDRAVLRDLATKYMEVCDSDRVYDEASRGRRNMPVISKMEDLDALRATPHEVLDPCPPAAKRLKDVLGDIIPRLCPTKLGLWHVASRCTTRSPC